VQAEWLRVLLQAGEVALLQRPTELLGEHQAAGAAPSAAWGDADGGAQEWHRRAAADGAVAGAARSAAGGGPGDAGTAPVGGAAAGGGADAATVL
jgi:hypothetical protein